MRDTPLVVICAGVLSSLIRRSAVLVRGVAFWAAIVLPILYLPLLLVAPSTVGDASILGPLLTFNVAALVVGHGYGGAITDGLRE